VVAGRQQSVEALIGEGWRLDRVGYSMPNIVDESNAIENASAIQHAKDHLDQVLTPTHNKA
jgi:hypothetical protein